MKYSANVPPVIIHIKKHTIMKQHFIVKTSQVITTDKGTDKVEKQPWIVEAQSIFEALQNAQKYAEAEKLNDFRIISVAYSGFAEVHPNDSENNYKAVINWVMLDEEKGVEKRQKYNMLISADDFAEAEKRLNEIQNGTVQDWEIYNISQSSITTIVNNEMLVDTLTKKANPALIDEMHDQHI